MRSSKWGTLIIYCGLCGARCGLRHMLVHWLYAAIVRPIIFLVSVVWWSGCQAHNAKKKLRKLEIPVCTTPTGVMEALVGLSPLYLVIQRDSSSAALRLCSLGCWPYLNSQPGHSCILTRLQNSDPIFNMWVDVMRPVFNLEPKYRVSMLTRVE
jgi:hypothetical protein